MEKITTISNLSESSETTSEGDDYNIASNTTFKLELEDNASINDNALFNGLISQSKSSLETTIET